MGLFHKPIVPPTIMPPSQPEATTEQIALDCSWCASEQGKPTTESPGICASHSAQVLQQAQQRRQERQAR